MDYRALESKVMELEKRSADLEEFQKGAVRSLRNVKNSPIVMGYEGKRFDLNDSLDVVKLLGRVKALEGGGGSVESVGASWFDEWLAGPPKVSLFDNDVGYLTAMSEVDPVFTSWVGSSPDISVFNNNVGYLTLGSIADDLTVGHLYPSAAYKNIGASDNKWYNLYVGGTAHLAGVQITGDASYVSLNMTNTQAVDAMSRIFFTNGLGDSAWIGFMSEGMNVWDYYPNILYINGNGHVDFCDNTIWDIGKLGIKEGGASPEYQTFFQGGNQSGDITYTLPTASAAGYLTNNGSGVLSWSATATATAHNILDSTYHGDTLADSVVDGSIIIGNVTPKWSKLAISIPAANVRNVLGIDNGELRPSWKTALDSTNPTTIGINDTAAPGTSLVFAHRDHKHASPATWTATAHNILDSTYHGDTLTASAVDGDMIIGNVTPKWSRLAISIPAANVRNVLGIDNGELRPSWKTALDATNPTTIGINDTAAPGTSLVFSHRDHKHASPTTWTATAHNILDSTYHSDVLTGSILRGDILYGNSTPKIARLAKGNDGQYLKSGATDVAWADLPGSFSGFANPTAAVGNTVVNGSATTAMRSDAAPALGNLGTAGTHAKFAATGLADSLLSETANDVIIGSTKQFGLGAGKGRIGFVDDIVVDYIRFSDCYVGININPAQRLHVDGAIRWGGGVSAPYGQSTVDADGLYIEQLGNSVANENIRIQTSKSGDITNYSVFTIDPTGGFSFTTTGTGNGNVGIGTAAPAYTLDVTGNFRCSTGFSCNSKTPQTAYASGGALAAYGAGTNGLNSGANMSALHALVVKMRAALVANGIMS